jgi:hypothetical protein
MFSFEFWKQRWKTALIAAVIFAGIMAVWWFTMLNEPSNGDYKAVADTLKTEVADYKAHHDGNLPISGATITLAKPAGDYQIIDICKLMNYVPAGCAVVDGEANDNCDNGSCQCNASSHYIWAVDSYGKLVSECVGSKCGSHDSDGYQGVWP